MSPVLTLLMLGLAACHPDDEKPAREPADTSACSTEDGDLDGYSACDGDCDDDDASVSPGSAELADNGIDDDCDGAQDEVSHPDSETGDTGDTGSCLDSDLDGACAEDDCDDDDPQIHPGADERCNDQDDDCDGYVDEDAVDAPTWYYDTDGDLYGDPESWVITCDQPESTVLNDKDCDDGDVGSNPDAAEICDEDDQDEDCDGLSDDLDPSTDYIDIDVVYLDGDGDGFGNAASAPLVACDAIPGETSESPTDCDDTDPEVYPDAPEYCDEEDDDCDGEIDEASAVDASIWYADTDGDLHGDPAMTEIACYQPEDMVADDTDCDDGRAEVYTGAPEVCDDLDNDCDGEVDPDSSLDAPTWYLDDDGDGYGDVFDGAPSCVELPGRVLDATDCDDHRDDVSPAGVEVCDDDPLGTDEDCDGLTDDDDASVSAGSLHTWYHDADGDGYASKLDKVLKCDAPAEYLASADPADCDDTSDASYPGGTELCDGEDNDCDGTDDDDATDADTWYRDEDGDGYGDPATTSVSCKMPYGYVDNPLDCDDHDAAVSPSRYERCSTSVDDDCDGSLEDGALDAETWYKDADGDGYGNPSKSKFGCESSEYVTDDTDCDDTRSSVNPGEDEVCDSSNRDEDCDGAADDRDASATGQTKWYVDADNDGYGVSTDYLSVCDEPTSGDYSKSSSDCDDDNELINPGAEDAECNGLDDNCGTVVDNQAGEDQCDTYDEGVSPYCQQVDESGHAYLFCSGSMSWSDADTYCHEIGYHLLTIDDSSEQATIAVDMDSWSASSAWIGAKDSTGRGRWTSQETMAATPGYGYCPDTSALYDVRLIYTNWNSGAPDDDANDCIQLKKSGDSWGWSDGDCSGTKWFICESCDPL